MYVCSTHTPRSNIIYYHRLRVVYNVYMYLTYFAQMELQCGLKRWEAAEVKTIKCTPFGIGGAVEEWGLDLELPWGWRGLF